MNIVVFSCRILNKLTKHKISIVSEVMKDQNMFFATILNEIQKKNINKIKKILIKYKNNIDPICLYNSSGCLVIIFIHEK